MLFVYKIHLPVCCHNDIETVLILHCDSKNAASKNEKFEINIVLV